jgi:hypothetical protein
VIDVLLDTWLIIGKNVAKLLSILLDKVKENENK